MSAPPSPSALWRFASDAALTLGQQMLTALCTLLTSIIVARALGPTGQGAYGVAFAVAVLTMTLTNLGVGPATVYYVGSHTFSAGTAARQNVLLAFGLGTAGSVALLAVYHWHGPRLLPNVTMPLALAAACLVPVAMLNNFMVSVVQGAQRFTVYNRASLLAPLATLLCIVPALLWWRGGGDPHKAALTAVAAQWVGQLIAAGYGFAAARHGSGAWWPQRKYLQAALSYGVRAYLSNALTYLNYRLDIFLLNAQLSAAAVGIYSIAVGVGERLWLLSYATSAILLPRVARGAGDPNDSKHTSTPPTDRPMDLTAVVTRHVFWAVTIAAAGLAITAPWLLPWIFGGAYAASVLPLWALLPGIVTCSVARLLSNDLAGRGQPGVNAVLGLVAVAVNLAANLVFIPRWGAVGAALASSLAYSGDAVLKLWIYCRQRRAHPGTLLWPQPGDVARLRRVLTQILARGAA